MTYKILRPMRTRTPRKRRRRPVLRPLVCPLCKGHGHKDGKTCLACDGQG